MSWAASCLPKKKVAVRGLGLQDFTVSPQDIQGGMLEQFQVALEAAQQIAVAVPGPKVTIVMSGHANEVGWQKKEGWANDCITVSVTQVVE